MKTYIGTWTGSVNTVVVEERGNESALNPQFKIRNHSPDGFNWGYGGSGPAQLALAIMCDLYGDRLENHPVHYQNFKFAFVGKLPPEKSWVKTETEIKAAIDKMLDPDQ